uniref:Uncharacterized protein n=1 Tax=Ditylenchus dipsaci TaxID=166011 RepID=A0A915DFU9_9BILA
MRLFYCLKLMQAWVAVFLLLEILSTSELCSVLLPTNTFEPKISGESCKQKINETESVGVHSFSPTIDGAIRDSEIVIPANKTRLGVFFSDVLKSWDQLWGNGNYSTVLSTSLAVSTPSPSGLTVKAEDITIVTQLPASTETTLEANDEKDVGISKKEEPIVVDSEVPSSANPPPVSLKVETGFKQCLKVSFYDFFGFGPRRSLPNKVLRLFSAPMSCIIVYLLIVFLHVIVRGDGPYGCEIILMVVSGCSWTFVLLSMLTIDYNWNKVWESTGPFIPEVMGAVLSAKVLSLLMFLAILLETIFNEHLAKKVQLKRVINYYEVNERSSAGGDEGDQECLLSGDGWMDLRSERSYALASVVVPAEDSSSKSRSPIDV